MKVHIKAEMLTILIERPYALPDQPAFDFKVENYELKADWGQLIDAMQDLIKKLTPPDVPFEFGFDPEREAAEEALARAAQGT